MNPSLIEESFLSQICEAEIFCMVYLISGVKLQGKIIYHDAVSIIIKNQDLEPKSQLVYKNAISTITPTQNVEIK